MAKFSHFTHCMMVKAFKASIRVGENAMVSGNSIEFYTIFAPGFSTRDYPGGLVSLSDDQKIQAFENSLEVWKFRQVRVLLDIPDSGFAIMQILLPFPD